MRTPFAKGIRGTTIEAVFLYDFVGLFLVKAEESGEPYIAHKVWVPMVRLRQLEFGEELTGHRVGRMVGQYVLHNRNGEHRGLEELFRENHARGWQGLSKACNDLHMVGHFFRTKLVENGLHVGDNVITELGLGLVALQAFK